MVCRCRTWRVCAVGLGWSRLVHGVASVGSAVRRG